MNRTALCLLSAHEVLIIAFVLMDNHVHFILYGTEKDCMCFMALYKKYTGIYLAVNKLGKLENFECGCWLITNKEKLIEKISYVLRNPLAAGMGILPTSYPWGSGTLMFAGTSADAAGLGNTFHTIGATSAYARRKMFGTRLDIPENWLVNDEGMIWPGSYVEYRRAESSFGSIVNFMYELNKKNEDIVNQEMYGNKISLNDFEVMKILKAVSMDQNGIGDISVLSIEQRLDLIREMRRTHGTDIKQLGRLLHLKHNDLKLIWNS